MTRTGDESGSGVGAGTVADLLEADERPIEDLRIGGSRVVLTDERLVVVRDGGTRLRAVDRADLGRVRTYRTGEVGDLLPAVQWAVVGGVLLGSWAIVPFEVFVQPVEAPPGTGLEEFFTAVNTLVSLLAYLDVAFLVGGVLAFGWAGVRLVSVVRGRERGLEVNVVGGDPVRFATLRDDETADHLRSLLERATTVDHD